MSNSPSESWVDRLRWPVFVLPFLVYMLVGALEPKPPVADAQGQLVEEPGWLDLGLRYKDYPLVYTAKIALTVVAMLLVAKAYPPYFRGITPLALGVGLLGGAVWIGLCQLGIEQRFFASAPAKMDWLRDLGKRAAFNPLEQLKENPAWAYGFLAIRLLGLVVIVPIIEEFFLRGFLLRYVISPEWWTVGFQQWHKPAFVLVTLFGIATHPAEAVAAGVWFSGISWLMLRTGSLGACVVAHSITNLTIGVFALVTGDWKML